MVNAMGQLYSLGIWNVKAGQEQEFVKTWAAFSEWTVGQHPEAGEALLLQDTEKPGRYVSLSPWQSARALENWREHSRFGTFVARAGDLCDEIQPHTLQLVANAAVNPAGA
jgi:heme-degrading monooxygenase HmoA